MSLKPFYTFCSLVCSLGGVDSPDVLFTDSLFSCVYSTAKCIYCVLITLDSLLFPCDSFLHIFKLSVKILNREYYVLKLCSIFLLKCLRDVSIICLHMLCFILFQKVICFLFSEWSILLIKHWEVLWGVRKCSALRKFLGFFFWLACWTASVLVPLELTFSIF